MFRSIKIILVFFGVNRLLKLGLSKCIQKSRVYTWDIVVNACYDIPVPYRPTSCNAEEFKIARAMRLNYSKTLSFQSDRQ